MSAQETIRATYRIETAPGHEPARVAELMCGELGAGANDRAPDGRPLAPQYGARVAAVRPSATSAAQARAEVEIEISLAVTGEELIGLATAVLGNVHELPQLTGIRLLDLVLPQRFQAAQPGPAFGVEGTRRLAQVPEERPLIGSIVKPSVGLTPAETAERVRALGLAGIDFVKDDELLTSPAQSPFGERVRAVMRAVEEVADATGRKPMFAFNISSDDPDTIRRNHDLVLAAGGTCVMASLNQIGLGAFLQLRRDCALPIHGHRNGWGMLTRAPGFGMEFRAYQRIWRLAGVDQLHCNGFSNKFFESDASVARSVEACLEPCGDDGPILPVLSSGQWGGQAPATYARLQTTDLLYLAGGGIQGHPGGFAAGVTAVRAAWEAAIAGEPLADKARREPALAQAIETFSGRVGSA